MAMVPEWDTASNTWTIKLSGTGFSGDTTNSELSVLGKVQKPVALLSTVAVFRVTDVFFGKVENIKMYFDIGTPGPSTFRKLA